MPKINCAIYTRKSTEHGLDMEFNSLKTKKKPAKRIFCPKRLMGGSIIKRIRTEVLVVVPWSAPA